MFDKMVERDVFPWNVMGVGTRKVASWMRSWICAKECCRRTIVWGGMCNLFYAPWGLATVSRILMKRRNWERFMLVGLDLVLSEMDVLNALMITYVEYPCSQFLNAWRVLDGMLTRGDHGEEEIPNITSWLSWESGHNFPFLLWLHTCSNPYNTNSVLQVDMTSAP